MTEQVDLARIGDARGAFTFPPSSADRYYTVADVVGDCCLVVALEPDAEDVFSPVSRFFIEHAEAAEICRPATQTSPPSVSLSLRIRLDGEFETVGTMTAGDGAELVKVKRKS